jgi:hypothetical protein
VQQAKRYGIVNTRLNAVVLHRHFAVLADLDLHARLQRMHSSAMAGECDLNNVAVQLGAGGNPLLEERVAAVVSNKSPANAVMMHTTKKKKG